LNYSELQTILTEVENVINSRPPTYIFDDQEGISYPLTPSQLINGRNLAMMPHEGYYEVISTYESLSRRANYNRKVLSQFSNRWKNEYLLNLLEAYRPKGSRKKPVINIGDIFILRNDHEKRVFLENVQGFRAVAGKRWDCASRKSASRKYRWQEEGIKQIVETSYTIRNTYGRTNIH